jgi:hypothetical protein
VGTLVSSDGALTRVAGEEQAKEKR